MQKIKFWLVQIVMVSFVSAMFAAPVLAHGNGYKYKKYGYGQKYKKRYAKRHNSEWIQKKMERKIAWQEKKIAKYEKKIDKYSNSNSRRAKRWVRRMERKVAWAKKKVNWYQKVLDRHKPEEPEEPTPGEEEPTPGEEEPTPGEEEPTGPQCSPQNLFLCTDQGACEAIGATWMDGVGCI